MVDVLRELVTVKRSWDFMAKAWAGRGSMAVIYRRKKSGWNSQGLTNAVRLGNNGSNGDHVRKVHRWYRMGKGSLASRRYSPHCPWSNNGFRMQQRDPVRLQHVATKNHHPRSLRRAQVTQSREASTIRSCDRRLDL